MELGTKKESYETSIHFEVREKHRNIVHVHNLE
jgi:hypothetical protein